MRAVQINTEKCYTTKYISFVMAGQMKPNGMLNIFKIGIPVCVRDSKAIANVNVNVNAMGFLTLKRQECWDVSLWMYHINISRFGERFTGEDTCHGNELVKDDDLTLFVVTYTHTVRNDTHAKGNKRTPREEKKCIRFSCCVSVAPLLHIS